MTTLEAIGLGKAYRRYRSELHRIGSWFGIRATPTEESWVLRDVSFSLEAGESVGVIGQNGAGKSTLMKLIAGTLRPTEGRVIVRGRIAAILELGMGFDPESTGADNARHGLRLMGFDRTRIEGLIPSIRAFAEIGDYFEKPMRTYSSGMHVRVAFAVATAVRPEILIIDEALSVGDAYFQHKSFGRIREFREAGTTLLLVSHDREAILSVCNRAILLERGRVIRIGGAHEVTDLYNARIAEKETNTVRQTRTGDDRVVTISGSGVATVEEIQLLDEHGARVEAIGVGERVEIRFDVGVKADIEKLVFGYMIRDRVGQTIYGTNTVHTRQVLEGIRSGERLRFRVCFPANIGPGNYSVSTLLADSADHFTNNYEWRDLALVFSVERRARTPFAGLAWLEPRIEIERGADVAEGSPAERAP